MGGVVIVLGALPVELKELRDTYGIKLADESIANVRNMVEHAPSSSSGCLVESGYISLLEDESSVRRLSVIISLIVMLVFSPVPDLLTNVRDMNFGMRTSTPQLLQFKLRTKTTLTPKHHYSALRNSQRSLSLN